jgi:hypothetical protein
MARAGLEYEVQNNDNNNDDRNRCCKVMIHTHTFYT